MKLRYSSNLTIPSQRFVSSNVRIASSSSGLSRVKQEAVDTGITKVVNIMFSSKKSITQSLSHDGEFQKTFRLFFFLFSCEHSFHVKTKKNILIDTPYRPETGGGAWSPREGIYRTQFF